MNDDTDRLNGLKVLVVDDDPRNTFAMVSYLKTCGMEVLIAEDGFRALEILARIKTDVILMDMMMPVMDGYETMRRIKENERLRDIPIIAVTAKAMAEDREKCVEAGASDYLSKPVSMNLLLQKMNELTK